MNNMFKTILKAVLPSFVIKYILKFRFAFQQLYRKGTERIFEEAAVTPAYLQMDMLEKLQQEYPFLPEYGYDAKSLEERGIKRVEEIFSLPGAKTANSFLELGCWDGMVSCVLHRRGKSATAIDNRSEGFDERAFHEGVKLIQMEADELRFEDESFDFVFSYDTFEHFNKPERVLQEAIRVARKGGHIYLVFGLLYMSPFGAHAYRSITVPYCQFLFPKEIINNFASLSGLRQIDFYHVNGWKLTDYRKLWDKYDYVLKKVKYVENYDLSHLSLIRKYPSCFKSKTNCFDNLVVSSISVLFKKAD